MRAVCKSLRQNSPSPEISTPKFLNKSRNKFQQVFFVALKINEATQSYIWEAPIFFVPKNLFRHFFPVLQVVNVYRLISKNTVEEKILGLQQFKLKTANAVISSDNSAVQTMATDSVVDLFSLSETASAKASSKANKGVKAVLDSLPELWDQTQYDEEYDIAAASTSGGKGPT